MADPLTILAELQLLMAAANRALRSLETELSARTPNGVPFVPSETIRELQEMARHIVRRATEMERTFARRRARLALEDLRIVVEEARVCMG